VKTGILREELRRAFLNKRFWLVCLLAAISFTYGLTRVLGMQQTSPLDAVTAWQEILRRGSYGFFAAMMAGLPFADSFLNDQKHHFIEQILLRCRYRPYLLAKVVACMAAGITAVGGPALLLLVACVLIFPFNGNALWEISAGLNSLVNPAVIEAEAGLTMALPVYVLLCVAMLALFGAAYTLIALGTSLVIRNPFVVLGVPFIVYSLGYYIIPTSQHLAWLGSSEAAILPSVTLVSALLQYLGAVFLFALCLGWGGKKNRVLAE
jgi:hypothetical protein